MKNKKLNVVDYILLFVILAAVALVAYKMLKPNTISEQSTPTIAALSTPTLRFTVLCKDVNPQLAESIFENLSGKDLTMDQASVSPCRIFNSNNLMDAAIVDWTSEQAENGVDLSFTVEAAPAFASGIYSIGWQELRLGKEYNLKTLGIEITGTVVTLENIE